MKAAPVYHALAGEPDLELLLVHTGQHYDARMSSVFLDELGLPTPDVFLSVGSGSHGAQTASALVGVERVLLEHRPALTVVAGDVNSTVAAALASVKLNIPVAHIESGLRSFDDRMPEEHNRRVTDHLSRILLAHSEGAVANLAREGIPATQVHMVGNTMIDSLLKHLPAALASEPWLDFDLGAGEYALVTLHRPSLVDDPDLFRTTMQRLIVLSKELPILFPVHPRTRARLLDQRLEGSFDAQRLLIAEPQTYFSFLGLEAKARLVLTDSGGVQEETSALGVPCFTLRDSTERPVTVEYGTNTLLGARPERISDITTLLHRVRPTRDIPLWDGKAGLRAAEVLHGFIGDTSSV